MRSRSSQEQRLSDDFSLPIEQIPDLRHRVRKLNWFLRSFHNEAGQLAGSYGLGFAINDRSLSRAFLTWAKVFETERPGAAQNRPDFVVFSGGLMLRELMRAAPVRFERRGDASPNAATDPMTAIWDFWPEGALYATYCLKLVRAILKSDFAIDIGPHPRFENLGTWESFRENVAEDVGVAVAFFDHFLGLEPAWGWPEGFLSRPAAKAASSQ